MKPSFLIIGLGNPGKSYESTRHNIGFLALDRARTNVGGGEWKDRQKFLCLASEATIDDASVLLVKPTTFMNRSGECVKKLLDFYKLDPTTKLLVVVDDLDLPLGTHRFRMNGGPGTHNGLKSIVESIGEGFPRLRIGFGPKPEGFDLASWVLSAMTKEERTSMETGLDAVLESVRQVMKKSAA